MRLILLILLLGQLHAQDYWVKWAGEFTTPEQRETILWYAEHYGVSIGAKCVLESSGGLQTNHGEDSHGDLGLYLPEARKHRPGYSDEELRTLLSENRHFQGKLAKEIDVANLFRMRFKQRPRLCAAMVYCGWRNWNNPERLDRGLRDLQWQELLEERIRIMNSDDLIVFKEKHITEDLDENDNTVYYFRDRGPYKTFKEVEDMADQEFFEEYDS